MVGWRGALLCVFLSQLWMQTPGIADKGCSGFGNLENGRMFFRYGGLYVTFTCNPGFRIHGYRTSSCVSGQWARDPPLCVASGCPSPGDLLHGNTVVSKDRSLAFFSCDTGFSLFGSALLFCKGKSWNGTKPVCKVADIMSVLHLKQEPLHSHDVPSLKVHLHSHLNTLAITAPKDAFLKTALLGAPHIKLDFTDLKQKNIEKPVEKKPSKILLFDKTQHSGRPEPISNFENFKDPIRNADLQKSMPVTSANVNTISLATSFQKSSFLSTTPTSFVIPAMNAQQVTDQTFTEAPYRRNKTGYQSTIDQSVILAAKTLPEYIKNNSYWISTTSAPNIITLGTDVHLQSETFIRDPHKVTTESFALVSKHESVSFAPIMGSTAPSTSGELYEQKPDVQETSPPPDTTGYTSSTMEVLTTTTQLVSDLHLATPTDVHHFTNVTDDHQINGKSNQSDSKQAFDTSAWKDLPRFPTRMRRPVCPYPPFPSHGTFYFRSIKNPSPHQYKHYIQYACYPGYTLTNGDVYSYCQHNGQWSGQTPLCLGCSQICHVNEQNRAQCLCKPGFLLLEDQRTCRDLDECVEELHLCQQGCQNTLGSYRCSCNPGFQLSSDGTSCSDINECEATALLQHRCEWKCVNLPGNYKCICPRGYRLHRNGHQCEDVNECELKNGSCSHLCINHRGGYKCACPETHRISPYNPKNCQLVDTHTSSLH
ncbi:Fibulin-2 [Labeo rohita]|uniref:Fibulin-2 n=1 Tax=Labeo rohita TaxID=84645 RepID=A0ABQ8MBA7_LABRO|nr:Fibulin-2 [Labeo rohita]